MNLELMHKPIKFCCETKSFKITRLMQIHYILTDHSFSVELCVIFQCSYLSKLEQWLRATTVTHRPIMAREIFKFHLNDTLQ